MYTYFSNTFPAHQISRRPIVVLQARKGTYLLQVHGKVYLIIEDQPGNGPYDSIRNVIAVYDNLKDAKKYISERKKTALINKDTAPPELYDTNNLFSYEDLKTKYYLNADINKLWHEIFYFDT